MYRRPFLYLDVDGPLNPYAANPERCPDGYTAYRMLPESWIAQHPGKPRVYVKPLRVWLRPDHGARLLDLGDVYEPVWAVARSSSRSFHTAQAADGSSAAGERGAQVMLTTAGGAVRHADGFDH